MLSYLAFRHAPSFHRHISTDIFVPIKLKQGKLCICFQVKSPSSDESCFVSLFFFVIPFRTFESASHCWQMNNYSSLQTPEKCHNFIYHTLSFRLSIYGLSAVNTQNDWQAESATKQTKTNGVPLIFFILFYCL